MMYFLPMSHQTAFPTKENTLVKPNSVFTANTEVQDYKPHICSSAKKHPNSIKEINSTVSKADGVCHSWIVLFIVPQPWFFQMPQECLPPMQPSLDWWFVSCWNLALFCVRQVWSQDSLQWIRPWSPLQLNHALTQWCTTHLLEVAKL